LDEVDAGERVVELLHRATCCQFAEVDPGEARVLEQGDDVRFRVGELLLLGRAPSSAA
jgi:hypothetical protein